MISLALNLIHVYQMPFGGIYICMGFLWTNVGKIWNICLFVRSPRLSKMVVGYMYGHTWYWGYMYGHTHGSGGTCMVTHVVVRVHVWTHMVVGYMYGHTW